MRGKREAEEYNLREERVDSVAINVEKAMKPEAEVSIWSGLPAEQIKNYLTRLKYMRV